MNWKPISRLRDVCIIVATVALTTVMLCGSANAQVMVAWNENGGSVSVAPPDSITYGTIAFHVDVGVTLANVQSEGSFFINEDCTSCDDGDPRTVWLLTSTNPGCHLEWTWDLLGTGYVWPFLENQYGGQCLGNPVPHVIINHNEILEPCNDSWTYSLEKLFVMNGVVSIAPSSWTAIKNLYR